MQFCVFVKHECTFPHNASCTSLKCFFNSSYKTSTVIQTGGWNWSVTAVCCIWKGHKSSRMLRVVCQKYVWFSLFIMGWSLLSRANVTCSCWAVKWYKELFSLSSVVYQVVSCPTWVIITRKRKVPGMVVSGTGAGPVSSVFQVLVVVFVWSPTAE